MQALSSTESNRASHTCGRATCLNQQHLHWVNPVQQKAATMKQAKAKIEKKLEPFNAWYGEQSCSLRCSTCRAPAC